MPNQITTNAAETTSAGIISTTANEVAPTSAPEVTAPTMTASSSAPTRMPAARRVSWSRRVIRDPTQVRR
jgi:hypothetical protein